MEKTKLGISQGMLGAVVYFSAALLGYISLFIIGGYILLDSKKFASLKKPVNPNGFLTYPVFPE